MYCKRGEIAVQSMRSNGCTNIGSHSTYLFYYCSECIDKVIVYNSHVDLFLLSVFAGAGENECSGGAGQTALPHLRPVPVSTARVPPENQGMSDSRYLIAHVILNSQLFIE